MVFLKLKLILKIPSPIIRDSQRFVIDVFVNNAPAWGANNPLYLLSEIKSSFSCIFFFLT